MAAVGSLGLLASDQRVLVFAVPGSQLECARCAASRATVATAAARHTTLIIAHDPNVLHTYVDVFLHEGHVDVVGAHDELLYRNADYADLGSKHSAERAERAERGVGGVGGVGGDQGSARTPAGASREKAAQQKVRVDGSASWEREQSGRRQSQTASLRITPGPSTLCRLPFTLPLLYRF
jgi:hypothetical protein